MTRQPIVAMCLVTQAELDSLGANFDRAFPIDETPSFGDLLAAIDTADRRSAQDHAERFQPKG